MEQEVNKNNNDINRLIEEVYNKYENENPLEWKRDYSFFYGPGIFLFFSTLFILIQQPNFFLVFSILLMNFIFTSYNTLLFLNQRIYIYSTKLVYCYGLFNQKVKEFYYGTDDIAEVKAGFKSNLLQRKFNYANFYIINNKKLAFRMIFIKDPEALFELIVDKVVAFHREFVPDYQKPPTEIIKSDGVYIENENGEFVKKVKDKKLDIESNIVQT